MIKLLLCIRLFALCFFSLFLLACQSDGLTAAQRERLLQEQFYRTDEGWELEFPDKILFASDAADLRPQSRAKIERIGQLLQQFGSPRLRLDGHCDATGSDAYNEQLSLRRAQAVADILRGIGLPEESLQVRGLGKRLPLFDNKTRKGRAENRRVAIVVLAQ